MRLLIRREKRKSALAAVISRILTARVTVRKFQAPVTIAQTPADRSKPPPVNRGDRPARLRQGACYRRPAARGRRSPRHCVYWAHDHSQKTTPTTKRTEKYQRPDQRRPAPPCSRSPREYGADLPIRSGLAARDGRICLCQRPKPAGRRDLHRGRPGHRRPVFTPPSTGFLGTIFWEQRSFEALEAAQLQATAWWRHVTRHEKDSEKTMRNNRQSQTA